MAGRRYTRRQFATIAAAGMGGGVLLLGCGRPSSSWHFFSSEEGGIVEALTSRIIPTDDAPGAYEAGVVQFIDRQLVGLYRHHQAIYRAALQGVEQAASARFDRGFLNLDEADQIAVMAALETGDAPGKAWEEVSAAQFFRLLVDHTQQGFYGPPRHGGNRDYISYSVVGLDYPQILGRNRHEG